jgi:hypothetical protein
MAVFKKKSFAIYTVKGFIVIAGAEYGKVNHQNEILFYKFLAKVVG